MAIKTTWLANGGTYITNATATNTGDQDDANLKIKEWFTKSGAPTIGPQTSAAFNLAAQASTSALPISFVVPIGQTTGVYTKHIQIVDSNTGAIVQDVITTDEIQVASGPAFTVTQTYT